MDRGSSPVRHRLLLLLVALLGVGLVAPPAGSAPPETAEPERPPVDPGRASSPRRYAERARIYDDLEADMARRRDAERVAAIVLFTRPVEEDDVASHRAAHGDFPLKARWTVVNGYSAELTRGQIEALARRSDVVQIEAERAVSASMATARRAYGVDKAVTDFGVTGDGDGAARSYGARDVGTCVIDTGIDAGHADLDQGQVVAWRDEVAQRSTPYDDHGPGPHVAGILGGQGDANAGYRGVAPGSTLVGVKALDAAGRGTSTAIISGVDFCVANRATHNIRVLNMSLGSAGSSDGTDAMSVAVGNAFDNGLLPVVAAGNAGSATSTVGSPGAAAKAVTVCSLADPGEQGFFLSWFSSRGPTADGRAKPDLCAPGHRIAAPAANSRTGYVIMSGTSMAAPFVAGVVALMVDADGGQTPAQLRDNLLATAEDRMAPGVDVDTGAGRLRAYEAVKRAGGLSGNGPEVPDRHLTGSPSLAAGTTDVWQLEVTSTAHPVALTLIVPGASASRDFELNLLDPSGTRVAQSQTADRQETIGLTPATTGVYTAEVRSVVGGGEYHLDLSYEGAPPARPSAEPAPPPPAPGPGTYEDDNPVVAYTGSWSSTIPFSADSGGSTRYTYAAGGSAELRFSGTAVQWVARRQPNAGISDVLVDGVKMASVDLYNPSTQYKQVVFERTGLAPGEHTIRIVRTGTKNPAATYTFQFLDAFVVRDLPPAPGPGTYEEENPAVAYRGSWRSTIPFFADSGGSTRYTDSAGGSAELRFSGTAVQWVARRQPNAGISDVLVDGVKVASVDLYNPSTQYKQVVFERTGLPPGEHTIRVVRTGTKNAAATYTFQFLDAFVVGNTTAGS
ncbi:MAG TPA: S8 family serine peptidase [Acidimicrobiales bacterium]|nr:S8 family serine peptidase [Acidimicrobiales bacterium]